MFSNGIWAASGLTFSALTQIYLFSDAHTGLFTLSPPTTLLYSCMTNGPRRAACAVPLSLSFFTRKQSSHLIHEIIKWTRCSFFSSCMWLTCIPKASIVPNVLWQGHRGIKVGQSSADILKFPSLQSTCALSSYWVTDLKLWVWHEATKHEAPSSSMRFTDAGCLGWRKGRF